VDVLREVPRELPQERPRGGHLRGLQLPHVPLQRKVVSSISLTNKYSDSRWLLDRYPVADLPRLKMRHMLYHTGHRWFPVQFLSLTGASIADQKFVLDDKTTRTVYGHTSLVAGEHPPQWIQSLSPDSPAITYQYLGNEKKHHGAAA